MKRTSPARISKRQKALAWGLFFGLGLGVTTVDLWTKKWAFEALKARVAQDPLRDRLVVASQEEIEVIPGYFDFQASLNPGALKGLFGGHTKVLAIVSFGALFVIAGFVFFNLRKAERMDLCFIVALGLLWGGTLGNFYDRYFITSVRDFIKWYVVIDGDEYVWPNFNIADSAICVGVSLLVLNILRDSRHRRIDQQKNVA